MHDERDVVVYGSACPACTQAKAVLDHYGVAYRSQPISELPRRHGRVRSMPQITIGGELLGGINQLLGLAGSGGLARLGRAELGPWVRVRRRLGRGYDVELLDALGRVHRRRRVSDPVEAERLRIVWASHGDDI
ncbi:MAG TPA: glutaredoxin domain-containing protein [Gaiellales bacterium]|nr:glutaredoxin domain-containing protein [Gaiellales bacterium]